MISKEFVDYISVKTGIERRDLIEKDLILQYLLKELQSNMEFKKNFVFKGGTCLVKCHLGYYRFSEDLDFSWADQTVFKNKSEKQIRKILSKEIDKILVLLEKIKKELSLDFKSEKNNKKYVEFGGSNKFVTFKLWYNSNLLGQNQFIKIQINFVELFKYSFKKLSVKSLASEIKLEEANFLFPEETNIIKTKIDMNAYDLREILIEKSRAVLTRKATKVRDFIDLYFITKHLKENLDKYENNIAEKIIFMFKYEKYKENFLSKPSFLEIDIKEVESLLLNKPEKDFGKFIKETFEFFNKLIEVVKKRILLIEK